MIVFDTETTGLIAKGKGLKEQPFIVEFAGIKLDDESLEEKGRMTFFCRPPIAIPMEAVNVHHITDEMLANEKPFVAFIPELQEFFFGERKMVAHYCDYDKSMLSNELQRAGYIQKFPWPMEHICTIERSYSIQNFRLNLAKLHKLATGEDFVDAHRAMPDCEALVRCVRWLRKEKRL